MASAKVRTLDQAISEVEKIMNKYDFPYQKVDGFYTGSDNWYVNVTTNCEDDDLYDKIYTRCGMMNEERCLKDLTVFLDDTIS